MLAAVILGGTSLMGGSGTILKTVIGVLILGFIQNGLLLMGLDVTMCSTGHLGGHHPRRVARHRRQARPHLFADRLKGNGEMTAMDTNAAAAPQPSLWRRPEARPCRASRSGASSC